jgi:hypothetical protein
MKTITRKENIKYLETKEKDVTYFVSEDGKEFRFEKDCIDHEENLKKIKILNDIKKIEYKDNKIYMLKNRYEQDMKFRSIHNNYGNLYFNDIYENAYDKIKEFFELDEYPKYVGYRYEDGGDYRSSEYYYDINGLKPLIDEDLRKIIKIKNFLGDIE